MGDNKMPRTVKLAEYLFTRLKQLGIGAIHGVPGDYNLTLLDHVEPSGLTWVGSANELNAGYAADGYARIKGFGALITTFGVGELSAINAIAGAFTERAGVVHIVGTPARNAQDSRLMVHHTLGDGDYRHFGQMAAHVTAAQTNLLDPRTAAEQIDQVLRQCIIQSRPVYIELPVDMVAVPILADGLNVDISVHSEEFDPSLDDTTAKVLDKIYAAKKPIILIDGEARGLGLVSTVQEFVNTTQWPTFTTGSGNGLIDMTASNVYGIYEGSYADPKVRELVESSDLALCFGAHFSTTNTYRFTGIPKSEVTIAFDPAGVSIDKEVLRQTSTKATAQNILHQLDKSRIKKYDGDIVLPRIQSLAPTAAPRDELLRQDKAWRVLANFLRPGDIVLGETGTAAYGVRQMPPPKHSRFFTSITWLSIGYMLPATQGAALAQRELIASNQYHDIHEARTVLFIGDGSFQMTVQELATIIRLKLNVVLFLVNNDGYTIERCIHGINQRYNDISPWRYLKAPSLFGAPEDTFTGSAKTYGELQELLGNPKLTDGTGLRMVEIFMDRLDAPAGPLLAMLDDQKALEGP